MRSGATGRLDDRRPDAVARAAVRARGEIRACAVPKDVLHDLLTCQSPRRLQPRAVRASGFLMQLSLTNSPRL